MSEKTPQSTGPEVSGRGASALPVTGMDRRNFLRSLAAAGLGLAVGETARGGQRVESEDESKDQAEKPKDYDTIQPPKEIAEKLKEMKVGERVVVDVDGEKTFTVTVGKEEIDLVAHVGQKGKVAWCLEEHPGIDGEKRTCVVLRLARRGDNPSLTFSKLAPRIKQICFVKKPDIPVVGTVYVGKRQGDGTENVLIDNRFGTTGNYGEKVPEADRIFYIMPRYVEGEKVAEGTTGVFISHTDNPGLVTDLDDVGIVLDNTQFEKPKG